MQSATEQLGEFGLFHRRMHPLSRLVVNQFPGQQADILAVIRFSELEQGAMKRPIAAHSLPRETPCDFIV